jgi:homocysteine S-methyltransferase
MPTHFPDFRPSVFYLTEGGQETELMYKFGHPLPEFALFPLLDKPDAVTELKGMYARYLDVAAKHGFAALMGGLDYRASPDWGGKLGLNTRDLEEMQLRSIEFLRDCARPYTGQIPDIKITGIVGPRGDAYQRNETTTADSAHDYHSAQLETLKKANVDLVSALTFNNVPEAVGLARAAAEIGLPLSISFTLITNHRLLAGPTLRQAIEAIDQEAGASKPSFYGINCSHPLEFEPALEPGPWFERVRSLRPNAAMMDKVSLCKLGHLESGDPQELGGQMGALAKRYPHLDIWGGCCGTWESHLDEIARHVRAAQTMH